MDRPEEIHILLDANIALHYLRIDQIDWVQILDTSQVILVITPVFLRELEKNKVHNPSKKLRKRANQFISWIADAARSNKPYEIREGVIIKFITHDPDIDFSNYNLLPSLPDDWLIASAITYKNETLKYTYVATADLGLEIKLRNHGFDVVVIPEDLLLPEEQDSEEQELTKLRQELAELKARNPKLSLCFLNKLNRINVSLLAMENLDTFKDREMNKIKQKHPKTIQPKKITETPSHTNKLGGSVIDLSHIVDPISALKNVMVEQYNKELDIYYKKYDNYLPSLWKIREKGKLSFEIRLLLLNNGTAPASNINVVINFPQIIEIIDFKKLSLPKRPTPPSQDNSFSLSGITDSWRIPNLQGMTTLRDILNEKVVSGPKINYNKYIVKYWLNNLKHNFDYSFESFRIGFRSREEVCNFSCDYQLHPDESPGPIEGKLHFILHQSNKTTFDEENNELSTIKSE